MKNSVLKFCDALYLACIWVAGISIFVMSLIIPWGIFTRYVLGTGSQWPEPIAILLMVIFTFFGAQMFIAKISQRNVTFTAFVFSVLAAGSK